MQQQVMKRNMSSDFGWGSGTEGSLVQKSTAPGSGSWASTANLESTNSPSSSWHTIGKSDNASDTGDDVSSVKSGSTITSVTNNNTPQSQDSTITHNTGSLQTSSSSPWSTSNSTLSTMDSNPWGNSSSSVASSIGSMGWTSNPSLSLSSTNNQGHNNIQGSNIIGSNSAFTSTISSSSSTVWPTSMSGNSLANTTTLPPNMSRLQVNPLSSQWQTGSILGNIGDFSKPSESAWNHPTSSLIDNSKDLGGASSDPRMWALPSDKASESQWDTPKSQWGTNTLTAGGDQGASSTELSFAQATLKGLKVPPAANTPQVVINSRQEEILRAIESHEGWGSRPIRQDTSWDVESSPKSHRKFSTDGAAPASNVWNNSNGTAIWESVRANQGNSSTEGALGNNSYNVDKDKPTWEIPPKTPKPTQDPNTWNVGGNSDPKTFGTWGSSTGGAGDASNKMWGQKPEVDSWGDNGGVQRTTSISSWGDDGDAGAWEDQRRMASSVGNMQVLVPPSPGMGGPSGIPGMLPQGMPGMNASVMGPEPTNWNDGQKLGWNTPNPAALNRTSMDEPWNKPPPTRTGWGDPTQDGVEVDNGTGVWAANTPKQLPPQPKVPGWGESVPQSQWNAAVGAKPKIPGWEEASWAMAQQRAKSERYPEEVSTNSVEVGFWNGLPQDNSTWNDPAALRGVRKITGQQLQQKYTSSGSHPPTQMRAKLLQHLMDMGFRKEEAQNALITNNLNLELAINDLKAGNVSISRKDLDMDVFQTSRPQSRMPYMNKGLGGDDMPDIRPDQVPTFNNLQNTPYPNAQIPNQSFMQSNVSVPPSNLNPNNSSINPSLQRKIMQMMQQQQAPPSLSQRGPIPPVGSGTNSQVLHQQQLQLIRSQLHQAVTNGFISPQLCNYQLPHNILVLLHQLLQFQTALQTAMSKQQQLMQQASATGSRNNPQLEQMSGIITNINQQIINVQKLLQQSQNTLFSTQKPYNLSQVSSGTMTPQSSQQTGINMIDRLDALSTDLANIALQSQSRLTTQWKPAVDSTAITTDNSITTTTSTTTIGKINDETLDNKAPGGKSILQNSSSHNLNLIAGGLGMTGDKTWSSNMSTTSSSNWPLSSSDSTSNNSHADIKISNSTSISTSLLAGLPSGLSDVIPEFVPGKPWQGIIKNVEDDPHVTPGSIQLQRSLSVNRVHDDSLNNLDGHKLSSNSWGMSMKTDNSLGLSQLGSRPPPGMPSYAKGTGGQQWQPGGNFNRQTSWPHSTNSAFTKVSGSGWNDSTGAISSWILLKNLTVDPNTVRALCTQHGNLINFYSLAQGQLALVQYGSRDIAFGAQQRLNNFQMGSAVITADFFAETDAQRFTSQMPPPQPSVIPQMNASPWSQAPPSTPLQNVSGRSGDPWGNSMLSQQSSKYGSAVENWGLWDRPDHNFNALGNILGGESM